MIKKIFGFLKKSLKYILLAVIAFRLIGGLKSCGKVSASAEFVSDRTTETNYILPWENVRKTSFDYDYENGYYTGFLDTEPLAWNYANANFFIELQAGTYYLMGMCVLNPSTSSGCNLFDENNNLVASVAIRTMESTEINSFTLTQTTKLGLNVRAYRSSFRVDIRNSAESGQFVTYTQNPYEQGYDEGYESGQEQGYNNALTAFQRGIFNEMQVTAEYNYGGQYNTRNENVPYTYGTDYVNFADFYESIKQRNGIDLSYIKLTFVFSGDYLYYYYPLYVYGAFVNGTVYGENSAFNFDTGLPEGVGTNVAKDEVIKILPNTPETIPADNFIYSYIEMTLYTARDLADFRLISPSGNYNVGYQAGYENGKQDGLYLKEVDEKNIFNNGKKEGYTQGLKEGESVGYEKAVSEGVSGSGLLYGVFVLIKLFFKLMTDLLGLKIAGDFTIGLFLIGIPATFMIINQVIKLVKNLMSAGGGKSDE